jgi:hypothetical protein
MPILLQRYSHFASANTFLFRFAASYTRPGTKLHAEAPSAKLLIQSAEQRIRLGRAHNISISITRCGLVVQLNNRFMAN